MEMQQLNTAPPALWVELDRRLTALASAHQELAHLMKEQWEEAARQRKEAEEERKRKAEAWQRREREREEVRKQEAEERKRESEAQKKKAEEQEKREEKRAREADKRFRELQDLFTSQWGRLVESLVDGALVPLFQDYGIPIQRTARRVEGCYKGQNYEFDILVINGDEIVIVEVKTTLRPRDVTKFIAKLDKCKVWMREYASKTVYGGMAFIQADADAHRMAENQKLFVIRATGDSAAIINGKEFKPRAW